MISKNQNLDELEIKILLKCSEKALSKRDITQFFKTSIKPVRDNAVIQLSDCKFIEKRKLPKPHTKKTPTYYFITQQGKLWIKKYLKSFNF